MGKLPVAVVPLGILVTSLLCGWPAKYVHSQELHSVVPPELVGPTQRLAVEQIEALIESKQNKDVISQLQLLQELPPSLIERSTIQSASTQHLQSYLPLQLWCQQRLKFVLAADAQLNNEYEKQWSALAEAAYRAAQRSKDTSEAFDALARFGATSQANVLGLLLADIHFEQNQFLAGWQILDSQFPAYNRTVFRELDNKSAVSIPWYRAWQSIKHDEKLSQSLLQRWGGVVAAQPDLATEILSRQVTAAALAPKHLDYDAIRQWIKAAGSKLPQQNLEKLSNRLADAESWLVNSAQQSQQPEYMFTLQQRSTWQTQLDRWINSSDLTPATRPAVGQLQAAQPYFPVIYEGKVFLHTLTKIRAFELEDGKAWPKSSTSLFDSQTSATAYLPLGYPLQGTPRAGLSILDGCLYARMGSPVTGWNNRTASNDGSSLSYLVGLDLDKQGRSLRGFPLRLAPPKFEDAEFEGTPVVVGQTLVAAVSQRDNVGVRRSLAAFDRFSGKLLWHTSTLGSGSVVGSEGTNLVSASQPTIAGGLIYYATDLGTVACVDLKSGRTIWISRYQRMHRLQGDYPKPNRFRYRDGNGCVVDQNLIYCMPQDCPELLAIDAFTGDLVWSTNDQDVCDCTYLLGVQGESLIAGGDRLVWLDRTTGRLLGQFPMQGTPGVVNALPQPRGMGRAFLIADRVYWPTSEKMYVFGADPSDYANKSTKPLDTPPLLQMMESIALGNEGGNVYVDGPWVLLATPGRLICFYSK